MKPTLRQLEYLVAIADTGTFSEAAKRTFVSQPSLSAQVKDMEFHIGAPVLERGRHGAYLTPLGETVAARARIILRDVEMLKTLAREIGDTLAGRVHLGVLPSVGPYLLPSALHELHTQYPDLRIGVREERTSDLQEHLADGRFDVIVSTADDHPETSKFNLVRENLYLCMAPDDPLAVSTDPVMLHEFKGRVLLSLGYGHKLSNTVQNLAELSKATVSGEYEGTSLDAVRQMASMGESLAVLPSLYAISEAKRDPDLIVRPIDHPIAKRQISLIWRRTSPLEDKFTTIGKVFKQAADKLMA